MDFHSVICDQHSPLKLFKVRSSKAYGEALAAPNDPLPMALFSHLSVTYLLVYRSTVVSR